VRSAIQMLTCVFCMIPSLADAYIGPGAGITAIGSFLALLGGIVLALVGFVWYPLKRRFSKKRRREIEEEEEEEEEKTEDLIAETAEIPEETTDRHRSAPDQ